MAGSPVDERVNTPATAAPPRAQSLRLLTYNMQVGITTDNYHHYVTRGWRHLMPARRADAPLQRIAKMVRDYDFVALQEVDSGSWRTGNVDQVTFLAEKSGFPFWYRQVNRNLGKVAQHSNALLARYRPFAVEDHKLPGRIPGRGALIARFGDPGDPLVVVVIHLSLSRRARHLQLSYLREQLADCNHIILMGDLNCTFGQLQHETPRAGLSLQPVGNDLYTYPSWRPRRSLDHILVSPSVVVEESETLLFSLSDHLPLATRVTLPDTVSLTTG